VDQDSAPTRVQFDRHAPTYKDEFADITRDLQSRCPLAFSETYGGHWVASGQAEVFEIARRADVLSNDRDVKNERKGYAGISIPSPSFEDYPVRTGFLEMDPPEQRDYRDVLNPYLSPRAAMRWQPMVDDLTRACLDEVIESGRIDFVDDLANIVPAVLTLALMGLPLADWPVYCEPAHAQVYTKPGSPDHPRVMKQTYDMVLTLGQGLQQIKQDRRPGLVLALADCTVNGETPPDEDIMGVLSLLIGGGFDTTTALTAHALEWLEQHPDQRERLRGDLPGLLNSATEEFLRFYTPAPGDARTITQDVEMCGARFTEGDRIWISWAMANRDPQVFPDPDELQLDRKNNRHSSFGLGIHRCIGSNVARMQFKAMLTAVLDRLPDYVVDPAETVHYDSIGVINGMKHLRATFTPGARTGAGLTETIARWQLACDAEELALPVTLRTETASLPAAG
jgi:cytochrome P450